MAPSHLRFLLLALVLLGAGCCSVNGIRKDPIGDYWRSVMKDEPMPKAIQSLLLPAANSDHQHPAVHYDTDHNFKNPDQSQPDEHIFEYYSKDDALPSNKFAKGIGSRPDEALLFYSKDDALPSNKFAKGIGSRPDEALLFYSKDDALPSNKFAKGIGSRPDEALLFYSKDDALPSNKFAKGIGSRPDEALLFYSKDDAPPSNKFAKGIGSRPDEALLFYSK
nr:TPA: flax LLDR protein Lu5-45630 [Linum usitatissimum]